MMGSVEDSELSLRTEIQVYVVSALILLIIVNSLNNNVYCVDFLHQMKWLLLKYNVRSTPHREKPRLDIQESEIISLIKHSHIRQNKSVPIQINYFALAIHAKSYHKHITLFRFLVLHVLLQADNKFCPSHFARVNCCLLSGSRFDVAILSQILIHCSVSEGDPTEIWKTKCKFTFQPNGLFYPKKLCFPFRF
jgi:hypothetical protein